MTTQIGFGLLAANIPSTLMSTLDPDPINFVQEVKTEGGTSSQTTVVAPTPTLGLEGCHPYCRISTSATGLYVSVGSNPNSQTDTNRLWFPAAGVYFFSVPAGVKAAISTA
jgi:hypothetical protein